MSLWQATRKYLAGGEIERRRERIRSCSTEPLLISHKYRDHLADEQIEALRQAAEVIAKATKPVMAALDECEKANERGEI